MRQSNSILYFLPLLYFTLSIIIKKESISIFCFQAYAAGCNIVILASNFERVQIIPGAIHGYIRIGSLDCSTDTGKIAAAYGAEVCIFEPTPLIHTAATTHVSAFFKS